MENTATEPLQNELCAARYLLDMILCRMIASKDAIYISWLDEIVNDLENGVFVDQAWKEGMTPADFDKHTAQILPYVKMILSEAIES